MTEMVRTDATASQMYAVQRGMASMSLALKRLVERLAPEPRRSVRKLKRAADSIIDFERGELIEQLPGRGNNSSSSNIISRNGTTSRTAATNDEESRAIGTATAQQVRRALSAPLRINRVPLSLSAADHREAAVGMEVDHGVDEGEDEEEEGEDEEEEQYYHHNDADDYADFNTEDEEEKAVKSRYAVTRERADQQQVRSRDTGTVGHKRRGRVARDSDTWEEDVPNENVQNDEDSEQAVLSPIRQGVQRMLTSSATEVQRRMLQDITNREWSSDSAAGRPPRPIKQTTRSKASEPRNLSASETATSESSSSPSSSASSPSHSPAMSRSQSTATNTVTVPAVDEMETTVAQPPANSSTVTSVRAVSSGKRGGRPLGAKDKKKRQRTSARYSELVARENEEAVSRRMEDIEAGAMEAASANAAAEVATAGAAAAAAGKEEGDDTDDGTTAGATATLPLTSRRSSRFSNVNSLPTTSAATSATEAHTDLFAELEERLHNPPKQSAAKKEKTRRAQYNSRG